MSPTYGEGNIVFGADSIGIGIDISIGVTLSALAYHFFPSRHTTSKWRRINVDAMWSRRIDVDMTSF